MPQLPPDTILAVLAFVGNSATTAGVIQAIKVLFIDPRWPEGDQRDVLLRVANYVVNLILILLVVLTAGVFDVRDLMWYLLLAGGQGVLSHFGFTWLKSDGRQPSQGQL